jgi:hypothetical protein
MADYLLYLQIRMLFGGIVIKQCLQIVDEVVLVIGDLKVGHYDVVGRISPAVVDSVKGAISFA